MSDYSRNVTNPYYSIISGKDFWGGSDPIRVIIIIYIILSLIFNLINFTVIGVTIKIKKKVFPIALWVMLTVLLMNFIHTFTYFYEWVIKNGVDIKNVKIGEDNNVNVGALLTGNPKHLFGCYTQGFFLIFSSISQDFLINIFFYLVNSSNFNESYAKIGVGVLGFALPFLFTLILGIVGGIGLNDRFCYVKKFNINFKTVDNEEYTVYSYYSGFQAGVIIVYLIRVFNFFATVYFLIKIWNYVNQSNQPKSYLFKSVFIPFIQLFTIGIGVIYRFINMASPKISAQLSGTYLILNTCDGVLFPIAFALQNNIFSQIKKLYSNEKENNNSEGGDGPIEFIERKNEDEEETPTSS